MTWRELLTDALLEIGAIGAGETPSATDISIAKTKANLLLNDWNAERAAVYAAHFATYTLVANVQPTTIGPSGATWTVAQRPVSIDSAQVIINSSNPAAYQTIDIHDAQWWAEQSTPQITSTFPTDLYYQADWPNGAIYFWPVPTNAYQVQLQTRVLLEDAEYADTFSLPPGYRNAIMLTVAEMCCTPFAVPMPIQLPSMAQRARARIFANNDVPPVLVTADFGMQGPAQRGSRADFNFLTGSITSR